MIFILQTYLFSKFLSVSEKKGFYEDLILSDHQFKVLESPDMSLLNGRSPEIMIYSLKMYIKNLII